MQEEEKRKKKKEGEEEKRKERGCIMTFCFGSNWNTIVVAAKLILNDY